MSWTCLLDLIVCGHETLEQLFYSFKFNQAKKELIVVLNVEKEPLCISYHHEHILHKRSLSNVIVLHNYHSYRTVMHSSSHSSTWLSTNHPLPVSRSVAQNTIDQISSSFREDSAPQGKRNKLKAEWHQNLPRGETSACRVFGTRAAMHACYCPRTHRKSPATCTWLHIFLVPGSRPPSRAFLFFLNKQHFAS